MAPNPDFIMQTLGGIVQAYASMLAIAGAFYIFMIERNRNKYLELNREIDELIIQLKKICENDYNLTHISPRLDELDIKNHDSKWFIDNIDERKTTIYRLREITEFREMLFTLNKFNKFKDTIKSISYKLFNPILFTCISELLLSIVLMHTISTHEFLDYIVFAYYCVITISILGFILFIYLINDINISELKLIYEIE